MSANGFDPTESCFTTTFTNNSTVNTPSSVTGSYYLWILAKDSVGNTAMTSSNIFYLDNTKPVITLNGSSTVTIDKGSTYKDPGATATDAQSGLNGSIASTGSVNPNVAGTYTITYNVSDKVGNAAIPVTRTIIVRDILAPVITLNGSNPTNIDAGTAYKDPGATALDDVDGNVTSKITVTSNVNPSIGGTYTVTYTVKDNANNTATATSTVNVYVTWYQTRTIAQATYYDNYAATGTTTYNDRSINNVSFALTRNANGSSINYPIGVAIVTVAPTLTNSAVIPKIRTGENKAVLCTFDQKVKINTCTIASPNKGSLNAGTLPTTSYSTIYSPYISVLDTDDHSNNNLTITSTICGMSGLSSVISKYYIICGFIQRTIIVNYPDITASIPTIINMNNVILSGIINSNPPYNICTQYTNPPTLISDYSITGNTLNLPPLGTLGGFYYSALNPIIITIEETV
jgi:hypothetical protein